MKLFPEKIYRILEDKKDLIIVNLTGNYFKMFLDREYEGRTFLSNKVSPRNVIITFYKKGAVCDTAGAFPEGDAFRAG